MVLWLWLFKLREKNIGSEKKQYNVGKGRIEIGSMSTNYNFNSEVKCRRKQNNNNNNNNKKTNYKELCYLYMTQVIVTSINL